MRGVKALVAIGLAVVMIWLALPALAQNCPIGGAESVEVGWFLSDIYIIADPGDGALDALADRLKDFFKEEEKKGHVVIRRAGDVTEIVRIVQETVQKQRKPVSVTIGAHGEPGAFSIGGKKVGEENDNETALIKGLMGRIENGLYFYSCSIAQGEKGRAFLTRLAKGIVAGGQILGVAGPEDIVELVLKEEDSEKKLSLRIKKGNCTTKDCVYVAVASKPAVSVTLTANNDATLTFTVTATDKGGDLTELRGHIFRFASVDARESEASSTVIDRSFSPRRTETETVRVSCIVGKWYMGRGFGIDAKKSVGEADTTRVQCRQIDVVIPTLTQWGLLALGLLLAGSLAFMIRRRFTAWPAGA